MKNPKKYTFNKIDHYPEDVWVINREYWKGKKKTPTKLPQETGKKDLSVFQQRGDLVFDPFLGSGTVAVVAQQEGRHFLGFEIVPEHCLCTGRPAVPVNIGNPLLSACSQKDASDSMEKDAQRGNHGKWSDWSIFRAYEYWCSTGKKNAEGGN